MNGYTAFRWVDRFECEQSEAESYVAQRDWYSFGLEEGSFVDMPLSLSPSSVESDRIVVYLARFSADP